MQTTTKINGTEYKLLAAHGGRELVQHPTSGDVMVYESATKAWSAGLAKRDVEGLVDEPSALTDVHPMEALAPETYVRVTVTTASGVEISATVTGSDVVIDQDGHWAGKGTLRRGTTDGEAWVQIECSAVLGAKDSNENDGAYEALERAIAAKL